VAATASLSSPSRPTSVSRSRGPRLENNTWDPFRFPWVAAILAGMAGGVPSPAFIGRAVELARLEAVAGAPLPAERMEGIHARSEGNPFYAEQLLAAGDAQALPATLAEVLLARVQRLSEPAQRVLRVAAVAGRRVPHRLLAEVSGQPEAELERGLHEAVSAGVLAHHCLASHDLVGALTASVRAPQEAEAVLAAAEAVQGFDVTKPPILVYERHGHRWQLGALEWGVGL
jgi:hypothetical protein